MATSQEAGTFLFGGILLGVWIFLGIINPDGFLPSIASWFFWGILGLVIAGGVYATRVAAPALQLVIWILVGVAIGGVGIIALLPPYHDMAILAAPLVFAGAGLIASALPLPEAGHS